MANLSLSDGDMSEFEKLTDTLEFQNKQYVKMLEKENQCISSLRSQIDKNKEMMERVESDISRMDKDTMLLHKQFVQAKDTLKNLKDTYNVMMDHEMALTKQLETLKIKSDEEQQFYQEQMRNYTNIKDEYIKKYKSYPLAIELQKKKETLSELQRDSSENEALITDLQQKIAKKEADLDSKVLSRMIIKIARLKLSTLQTEKEVQECLVEKTSLLQQLKEKQRTQETLPPDNQESSKDTEEEVMDCDAGRENNNIDVIDEPQEWTKDVINKEHQVDGINCTRDKAFGDSTLQTNVETDKLREIELIQESVKPENHNYDSNNLVSIKVSDHRYPAENIDPSNHHLQVPHTQKPIDFNLKDKGLASCMSGFNSRIQIKPILRPVLPKIPTFKPVVLYKTPPNEISKENEPTSTLTSRAKLQRPTQPTFTPKVSIPKFHIPRFSFSFNRSTTDSVEPLKGCPSSNRPTQSVKGKKQSSITTSHLSLPKLPEISASASNSASYNKPFGHKNASNIKISPEGNSYQTPLNSMSAKNANSILNKNDKGDGASVQQLHVPKQKSSEHSAPSEGMKYSETKLYHPFEPTNKDQSNFGFTLTNDTSDEDKMRASLFRSTSITDSSQQTCSVEKTEKKPSVCENSKVNQPTNNFRDNNKYSLASIFSCHNKDEENSQSPTAFSLVNLGTEISDDPDTPFLSFGDSSGTTIGDRTTQDRDRPTSLLNFFPASDSEMPNENPVPAFSLNFDNCDEKDEEKRSFFNFGKSNEKVSDINSRGGYFNLGKINDDDDDSERKGSLFNLF